MGNVLDGYWVDGYGVCADRREAIAATESSHFDSMFDRVLFYGEEVGFCGDCRGLLHPGGKCGPCESFWNRWDLERHMESGGR
jgi:hypothetical protein